jgi:LDH2 family malate/lactate/ureidoglycolate dehydrogenase
MSSTRTIPAARLREYCAGILCGLGVPPEQADTVADSLVEADLRGVDSHGANLIALYVSRIRAGSMRPRTEIRVISDDGQTLQLDGGLGPGQVAGVAAIEHAIERARTHGMAAVSVRESTHLGALAYYTLRAAEEGFFCMAFQNGPTVVPAFGGLTPLFSTNPFSYAVPAGEEAPIVYDVATTAVAGNKLLLARKRGESIPEGWANDDQGVPTTDPEKASMQRLQWFGGHKGFGIAMLVEILAGLLTNSSFGRREVSDSPFTGLERVAKGYLFLTLDVSRFLPLDEFRSRMDELVRDVRSSEPAQGVERIYVPGEIEHLRRIERLRDGIPLAEGVVNELERVGAEFGLGALHERQALSPSSPDRKTPQ